MVVLDGMGGGAITYPGKGNGGGSGAHKKSSGGDSDENLRARKVLDTLLDPGVTSGGGVGGGARGMSLESLDGQINALLALRSRVLLEEGERNGGRSGAAVNGGAGGGTGSGGGIAVRGGGATPPLARLHPLVLPRRRLRGRRLLPPHSPPSDAWLIMFLLRHRRRRQQTVRTVPSRSRPPRSHYLPIRHQHACQCLPVHRRDPPRQDHRRLQHARPPLILQASDRRSHLLRVALLSRRITTLPSELPRRLPRCRHISLPSQH